MRTKSRTCKIVLNGPLFEHWADYFGDFLFEALVDDGKIVRSTLSGSPADLGAFIGILDSLANLGLPVVSAEFYSSAPQTLDPQA